ncbi:MAG: hypothetical protein GC206_16385 [Alphaproteobacteria bacterium]|nr:hypothetical protein [Alphaproteobacteria bacterium]
MATIVAVDAAGYSRQSEIDEAGAVREIAALHKHVAAGAQEHGGRVFNTAGDGFMLEFSSASAAVACAEDILASARVPLRVGVHLGEVSETGTGDLLGRGVNIAARLRELAKPGAVCISGEVKRALPGLASARFDRRSVVRPDKMDERVEVFTLGAPWRPRPDMRFARRLAPWVVGAGAILAAAFVLLPDRRAERVAVLEFDTSSAPSLAPFADGLASQIVSVMSVNDLQAITRTKNDSVGGGNAAAARRGAASFLVDGMVREEGRDLRVDTQVIEAGSGVTLWSREYRRASSESASLQEQVAAHVADVLRCTLISRRPTAGEIDVQTLAIFLRACDRVQRFDAGHEEMYEAARQVTERAPRFSRGWSMLAMAAALASRTAPVARAETLRAQVRDAADRAIALDRANGEGHLALALIAPRRDWRARWDLVARALQAEPNSAEAIGFRGDLLAEFGLMSQAVTEYRRAAALDPLSPNRWSALIPVLTATGREAESRELRARLQRVWPDSPSAWFNRFNNAVFTRQHDTALAILDDVDSAPITMEQPMRAAFRAFLQASRADDQRALREAVADIAALAQRGQFDAPRAIAAASMSGELDTAFALAEAYFAAPEERQGLIGEPASGAVGYFLFLPPCAQMRRDVRFMALARQIGLLEFWTETGDWPDFCAEPGLPYDCRAAAR